MNILDNEIIILIIIILIGLYIISTSNKPEHFGTAGGTFQQLYAKDSQDE
jgi:hypothetical protein